MLICHIICHSSIEFTKQIKDFVGKLHADELKKIKYSTCYDDHEKTVMYSALILYDKLSPDRYIPDEI